ncbi:MAG: TonB family protein [Elusimicrobia bacterium]|nr:TonB family protein [Elusimicrobiota bacterium]
MSAVASRPPVLEAFRRLSLYQKSVGASIAAHLLLFGWLNRTPDLGPAQKLEPDPIDVDLRTPFRPRDPKDTRSPGAMKGAPAPLAFKTAAIPLPLPPQQTQPAAAPKMAEGDGKPSEEKAKEWVVPTDKTKTLTAPTLDSAPAEQRPAMTSADGTGPGGMNGKGEGTKGSGTGIDWVNRPPRLINKEEVLANLKRFYPELERRAGREGKVLVQLDIGEDGNVRAVQVLNSAGELFDEAAQKVGRLMRFEPELKASLPVRSLKKQSIYFQLTND